MAKNKEWNVVGNKKVFFIFSICLVAAILLCTIFMGVQMDINFKGGTLIDYTYTGTIDTAAIEKTVEDTIQMDVSVTLKPGLKGQDGFQIVSANDESVSSDQMTELTARLEAEYAENDICFMQNSSVDPVLGKEFFAKSMVAVGFAAICLVIYIAIRFRKIGGWSAGVMAIVALVNDLITVFGVFVIFRIPLDYNFIAVLLTILGYSVNDTIVIYDRIRENSRMYGSSIDRSTLVNRSINETLTRTINTTVSTLIAMVCVTVVSLVMGVDSIMSFAFPMCIGLISGTYTTICLAGPLWVTWKDYRDAKKA